MAWIIIAVAVVAVLVVIYLLIDKKRAAAFERDATERRAAYDRVRPVLEATRRGMTVAEVAAATGLDRRAALIGLEYMVRTRGAYPEQTQEGMVLVTRYVAEDPNEDATSAPIAAAGVPPGLPPRWLEVRADIVRTTPLERVQDIIHPFWLCPACGTENTSVMMLDGALMANSADYRVMLDRIAARPGELAIAPSMPCACKATAVLHRTVVCRTNPTRRHDMHITLSHRDGGSPRVSVLEVDGRYEHLPESTFSTLFRD